MAIPFPLSTVLGAMLAWQRDPTEERRQRLSETVGLLVRVDAPATVGAYLQADPSLLPDLRVGWGSLDAPEPPSGGTPNVALFDFQGRPSGSLWVDADVMPGPETVRALEQALDAAVSRAELDQFTERFGALDAATREIAGLHSTDRVLQLIADRVRELIGAQYAAIGIVDEFGVIERFVTSGISREQREGIGALPRGHGLLGLIVQKNRAYRIPNIAAHTQSSGFPAHHPPMTSFLGVPIAVRGRTVGNFYLTNKRNTDEFSESDERLTEMFALHAGIAIENARLHEQVQRLAVVDERIRIGKDLHDGIIQSIYGVGLSLEDVPDLMRDDPEEAAARIDRAINSLNLTIRDIRNFIFGLRPELAEQGGLIAGIATLVSEFRVNSVIDAELEATPELPEVGDHRRGELIKIVREALSNVARHSKATRATIRVGVVNDLLELSIADNGTGFAADEARHASHQGLSNIRTRATDLGGELTVESAPGQGTRITIQVPAFGPEEASASMIGGEL